MTSHKIAIGLVAVALFVGSVAAHAADIDAGINAYHRGDYATALRIFRQLAEQGDAKAQIKLGVMYARGWVVKTKGKIIEYRNVRPDHAEAARWFRKAAEQGDADAQYNLGIMYANGRGVTQDYVQAHMWYNLAAAQGKETASKLRDITEKMMTAEQIAEAQRLAREWKPKGK